MLLACSCARMGELAQAQHYFEWISSVFRVAHQFEKKMFLLHHCRECLVVTHRHTECFTYLLWVRVSDRFEDIPDLSFSPTHEEVFVGNTEGAESVGVNQVPAGGYREVL